MAGGEGWEAEAAKREADLLSERAKVADLDLQVPLATASCPLADIIQLPRDRRNGPVLPSHSSFLSLAFIHPLVQVRALSAELTKASQHTGELGRSFLPVLTAIEARMTQMTLDAAS